jgi:tripartite-type tricarboxylate transporter receptor subunit TctC
MNDVLKLLTISPIVTLIGPTDARLAARNAARPDRRFVQACCIATLALSCLGPEARAAETAAEYPSRQITLVNPFAAGGPTDLIARVVGQALGDVLGKPVVVEDRPGAGGAVGFSAIAHAAPDGYMLAAVDISFVTVPLVQAHVNYDPGKDFRMIGPTTRSTLSFLVAPEVPASNVADFLAVARRDPDAVKLAHPGLGSTPYLGALSFSQAAKLKPVLVPYQGMAPATTDLMSNRITGLFTAPSGGISLAKEGKVKMLAVMGRHRLSEMPDVPAFSETGLSLAGFEEGTWYGIAAPAGTPDEIVAKLNDALNKALADKSVAGRLAASDIFVQQGSAQDFQKFVLDQFAYWKQTIAAAGLKAEE